MNNHLDDDSLDPDSRLIMHWEEDIKEVDQEDWEHLLGGPDEDEIEKQSEEEAIEEEFEEERERRQELIQIYGTDDIWAIRQEIQQDDMYSAESATSDPSEKEQAELLPEVPEEEFIERERLETEREQAQEDYWSAQSTRKACILEWLRTNCVAAPQPYGEFSITTNRPIRLMDGSVYLMKDWLIDEGFENNSCCEDYLVTFDGTDKTNPESITFTPNNIIDAPFPNRTPEDDIDFPF